MNIKTIVVGEFQVNCFIVWDNHKNAIVIDPGADASKIISVLDKKDISVSAYLLTHGHMDHISAIADLCKAIPASLEIHSNDTTWMFNDLNQMPPFYSVPKKPDQPQHLLKDKEEIKHGNLTYRIISTPGHTPGSICFHFPEENILFSGDTLFAGSVGRTDLNGGNQQALFNSLKKLADLDDKTIVYPGHGPSTTIAIEKRTNPYMRT